MAVWAIADLHLSFGVQGKEMDIFGTEWEGHFEKIARTWKESIEKDDFVLLAGDFSWAKDLAQAAPDFQWLDALPGKKIMIKGNHDYWWSSISKVKQFLPKSVQIIQNESIITDSFSVAGARLWDTNEYSCSLENGFSTQASEEDEKVYLRELARLEISLKTLPINAPFKIAMTHYPPLGFDMKPTRATHLLEKYRVNLCIFGHLHAFPPNLALFGSLNGISYKLTSCDYLNFKPIKLLN